jgi:hypothetical protein
MSDIAIGNWIASNIMAVIVLLCAGLVFYVQVVSGGAAEEAVKKHDSLPAHRASEVKQERFEQQLLSEVRRAEQSQKTNDKAHEEIKAAVTEQKEMLKETQSMVRQLLLRDDP